MNILERALTHITTRDDDLNRPSPLEKTIQFFHKINDPIFGEVSIVQNAENKTYLFLRERTTESKDVMLRWLQESVARRGITHPHIVKLLSDSAVSQRSLCGSSFSLRQFFEFPKFDLRREIDRRAQASDPFAPSDLAHLSYQLLEAMRYLHEKNYVHGALSPSAVGLNPDGPIKVQLKLLGDEQTPNVREKALQRYLSRLGLYVSPSLYRSLARRERNFSADPLGGDVFAVGLTILEAGILRSVQNVYLPDGNFDEAELNRLKDEFRARYDAEARLLCSLIDNLLQTEDTRPSFEDMLNVMPKYQEVCDFFKAPAPANK